MVQKTEAIVPERFTHLLPTIDVILTSPGVHEYVIGLTAKPGNRRRAYRDAVKLGYNHFVMLAAELTHTAAGKLEKQLQTAVWSDPRSRAWRKYHPEKRGKGHRNSSGGIKHPGSCYVVYMAWR